MPGLCPKHKEGERRPSELCFWWGIPQMALYRKKGEISTVLQPGILAKRIYMLEQEEISIWGLQGQKEWHNLGWARSQLFGQITIQRHQMWQMAVPAGCLPSLQAVTMGEAGFMLPCTAATSGGRNMGLREGFPQKFYTKIIWRWRKWRSNISAWKHNFIKLELTEDHCIWVGSRRTDTYHLEFALVLLWYPDIL